MRKHENMKIDKLTPYEKNARTHSKAQVKKIAESIKEFGFINPVLVDSDFGIIAGHGRVEGAKLLGMEEVPCLFVEDLTEAQKRAYIIADNKLALDAGWDYEILSQELLDLDGMDFNLELTGFDLDEIGELINIDEHEDVVEDEFESELPEEPRTKYGEIYQLGRHRLMVGDSTKADNVLKLTDNQLVDRLLTDPPYNVDYTGSTKDALKIANDNMDDVSFRTFLRDAFSAADSVMKPGALPLRMERWCWASDRKQTTVINFEKPAKNDIHPTMKPVGLFDYQIKNNTKGGDIVLDLFAGSGTTIMHVSKTEETLLHGI